MQSFKFTGYSAQIRRFEAALDSIRERGEPVRWRSTGQCEAYYRDATERDSYLPTSAPIGGDAELPIKIVDMGGGDMRQAERLVRNLLNSEYRDDARRYLDTVYVGHAPVHPDGDTPCGWANMGGRSVVVSTRFNEAENDDTLKHELGHLKHGYSEESAEAYARNHF
ncbi:MAG: hypothetical protein ACKO7W_00385 [Elainella sp.]